MLKRIAEALEMNVLREHGIRMGHCAEPLKDPRPDEPVDVAYANDRDSLKRELVDITKGRDPNRPIDDDEFGI